MKNSILLSFLLLFVYGCAEDISDNSFSTDVDSSGYLDTISTIDIFTSDSAHIECNSDSDCHSTVRGWDYCLLRSNSELRFCYDNPDHTSCICLAGSCQYRTTPELDVCLWDAEIDQQPCRKGSYIPHPLSCQVCYCEAGGLPTWRCYTGIEICDNIDNDCDGEIDEGVTLTYYRDLDFDTYGDTEYPIQWCFKPVGYVSRPGDCDDATQDINPGAIEVHDGIDNDCDGLIDEND